MGEIKSVKVDNWGVFFLQKLQNFFNKTDYCDLTLQFRDNSQLKVHRLVLSACTDYFNVLEQTCELVDDALIMPNELQADVVVPIVNFMYTGTLEFELKMYGKLLRTAKEMNMTVLLKLLEAHRRTMEGVNRAQRPPSPKAIRRRGAIGSNVQAQSAQPVPAAQQRRILTSPNAGPTQQRRLMQTKTIGTNSSPTTSQSAQYRQQIGSTSLLKTNSGGGGGVVSTGQIRAQYGNITVYETTTTTTSGTHVKQEPEEPFEQLRKGYNNNKRPLSSSLISPPAKRPNIDDVKEFAEQQRMRKQIAAEYGDDPGEYESSMLDDDIHNDDDDDDVGGTMPVASTSAGVQAALPKSSPSSQQQGGATITINQNEKPPTIVVKDSTNSRMNHAKIIKEVLRQYPDLVKNNKNIRLKIMPNPNDQAKIIIKKEPLDDEPSSGSSMVQKSPQTSAGGSRAAGGGAQTQKTITQQLPVAKQAVPQKPSAPATSQSTAAGNNAATPAAQKRRIDSKTMHALIAMGAENTTGPWLCLRCGVNGRPISIPSYRGFRRHLINTHKETIDSALCEHCGWRSGNNRELHYHMEVEHKVKTPLYTFPECLLCAEIFLDTNALNQHMVDAHPDENKQQCIYCNKIFAREIQLYTHMKTFHKQQALEDGIIDYSDEEFPEPHEMPKQQSPVKEKRESKIKILSDISLPSAGSMLKLEPSSEATALSAVASGIATSINIANAPVEFMDTSDGAVAGGEPKFVNVDGNEMVLTAEQRKEIMSQLNQEHAAGGVVMVLNEPGTFTSDSVMGSESDAEAALLGAEAGDKKAEGEADTETGHTTEEEAGNATGEGSAAEEDFDDSQIYNEFNAPGVADEGNVGKKSNAGGLDESKESLENLEWAENLISAHEAAEDKAEEQKTKNDDAINQKLKELTGDWSDDENDDDEEPAAVVAAPKTESVETKAEKEELKVAAIDEDKTEPAEPAKKIEMEADIESAVKESKESTGLDETPEGDADSSHEESTPNLENLDDSKAEEDDLDLLMKSLHKDDTNETNKSPEKTTEHDEVLEKVENEEESVEVKEEDKTGEEDTLAQIAEFSAEDTGKQPEVEESKTLIEQTQETAENKKEEEVEIKSEKDSSLAETLEKDDLLAELIGDTPDLTDKDYHLSEVESKAPAKEEAENDVDPLEELMKVDEKPEATTKGEGVEPMETDEAEENPTAPIASAVVSLDENVAVEKPEAEIAPHETTTTTTTTPDVAATKSVDTVKSLISEWGEDDDEADEEQL